MSRAKARVKKIVAGMFGVWIYLLASSNDSGGFVP
jgi:hypothetical protein